MPWRPVRSIAARVRRVSTGTHPLLDVWSRGMPSTARGAVRTHTCRLRGGGGGGGVGGGWGGGWWGGGGGLGGRAIGFTARGLTADFRIHMNGQPAAASRSPPPPCRLARWRRQCGGTGVAIVTAAVAGLIVAFASCSRCGGRAALAWSRSRRACSSCRETSATPAHSFDVRHPRLSSARLCVNGRRGCATPVAGGTSQPDPVLLDIARRVQPSIPPCPQRYLQTASPPFIVGLCRFSRCACRCAPAGTGLIRARITTGLGPA